MKCTHCGSMNGHNTWLLNGETFCSQECAEKYHSYQWKLDDG